MAPKTFINVPVDSAYFPELKELKLRYAAFLKQDVSWGEFLKWLVVQVFGERETLETASWNIEHAGVRTMGDWYKQLASAGIGPLDKPEPGSPVHAEMGDTGGVPPGSPLPSNEDVQSGIGKGAKELVITGEHTGEVEYAEMGQLDAGFSPEESNVSRNIEAQGVIQNDVMSAEVARMTMTSVFLSERSCQRIAEILSEKIKGQN